MKRNDMNALNGSHRESRGSDMFRSRSGPVRYRCIRYTRFSRFYSSRSCRGTGAALVARTIAARSTPLNRRAALPIGSRGARPSGPLASPRALRPKCCTRSPRRRRRLPLQAQNPEKTARLRAYGPLASRSSTARSGRSRSSCRLWLRHRLRSAANARGVSGVWRLSRPPDRSGSPGTVCTAARTCRSSRTRPAVCRRSSAAASARCDSAARGRRRR